MALGDPPNYSHVWDESTPRTAGTGAEKRLGSENTRYLKRDVRERFDTVKRYAEGFAEKGFSAGLVCAVSAEMTVPGSGVNHGVPLPVIQVADLYGVGNYAVQAVFTCEVECESAAGTEVYFRIYEGDTIQAATVLTIREVGVRPFSMAIDKGDIGAGYDLWHVMAHIPLTESVNAKLRNTILSVMPVWR